MESIEAVRDAAARVMARSVGEVRLGNATSLNGSDRSSVVRFVVDDAAPGAPSSIIVKRAIDLGAEWDDPNQPDSPTTRFLNEWASLQFLGRSRPIHPWRRA